MGIIIAKFRKKPSTFDVLTKLEDEIVSIQEFQKRTQQTQRKIVFRFLLLAILIYVLLVFLLYLYFSQISQNQKLIWSIPLITFPLVIWLIKKVLTWYYNRKIKKNEKKLVTLKEKKKQILENVMETETYKVAKQILDKFANEPKKFVLASPTVASTTPTGTKNMRGYESVLRQRTLAGQNLMRGRISFGAPETPGPPAQNRLMLPAAGPRRSINVLPTPPTMALTPAHLARSILPRDRTVLDKMVDYLVGDGPTNRYALICKKCSSHNGMALKEEFEYLSFKCCYCSSFNPARKKKPLGPKFESSLTSGKSSSAESSDSERNSGNDSDVDTKPHIEEPRSDYPDVKTSDFEKISDTESQNNDSRMEVDGKSHENIDKVTDVRESMADDNADVSVK